MIDYETLIKCISYDKTTGIFRWIKNNKNQIMVNEIAGYLHIKRGYVLICINGVLYHAHRLAWLYENKELPSGEIDHINHVKHDNRIVNLRVVDRTSNNRNASIRKDNKSGFPGVCFSKRANKWQSSISINGKKKHLGYFVNFSDAVNSRIKEQISIGYHINHGE